MSTKMRIFIMSILSFFIGLWVMRHTKRENESLGYSSKSIKIAFDANTLKNTQNIVPLAVIGSGPAGLSAALYGARMKIRTVVFKGGMPGGQLMGTSFVENWPGVGIARGPDIMKKFEKHVASFGVDFVPESIEHVDLSRWPYTLKTDEGKEVHALAVIVATGSLPIKLKIEGEDTYWGRGVSTCVVCDAPFYKDRPVAVVGGGDSAAEAALELANASRSITLLVRGDKMRASAVMQDRLRDCKNVTIRFNTTMLRIRGDGKHVTHADIENTLTKKQETLTIDAVFLAVGHSPNTLMLKDQSAKTATPKSQLALDSLGYIKLPTRSQATSLPGVFAAGDVADPRYRQAGIASGDGIKAALDAIGFLRDNGFNQTLENAIEDNYFTAAKPGVAVKIPVIKTLAEYEEKTRNEKRPVVLDFYASTCSGCMRMMPVFEYAASQMHKELLFLKVDTGSSDELTKHFKVTGIPAFLVFEGDKPLSMSTEIMTKKRFIEYLKKSIAKA